ncbi:GDP-mannose 4,6-dehydratase [Marinicrinis lubricantis]|uniref:GDP-mannose 4,6-dehydratase n=1 Tax=Marinicrinis lubricantis TaxID=2086470 RepID=A0ABW1IKG1_9BACL
MYKNVLVTGGAGFIGSHLVDSLLADGCRVTVIDNFDPFYSRELKEQNIQAHQEHPLYKLYEANICDTARVLEIFAEVQPEAVVHLAAKAGVRPSVEDPIAYVKTNIEGTSVLLDASRKHGVKKFVFGSSSSVYGLNSKVPFSESDPTLLTASPYGATKAAGESLCMSFNNCYKLPIVALRFFTVYGPRQRPDLAIRKFTERIMNGQPIPLFGDGTTSRDYTFVSDIVVGIRAAIEYETKGYEVFNLGNDRPTQLIDLVRTIENAVRMEANIEWKEPQVGDVPRTWADLHKSAEKLGYKPQVPIQEGIAKFVEWMK